jgi:SAM-dependent methyltransferase
MHDYIRWKQWDAADFGKTSPEESHYFAHELRLSGVKAIDGLRVAELGFGNGAFAGWARRAGGIWIGIEAIPDLVKRAKQAGFQAIASDHDISGVAEHGTLDLIVAFDVLEHLTLDAIKLFLTGAKGGLRPGGLVILRVPSGDSPFVSQIYCGDITHQTLLGSSAVRQLAGAAGLEVSQIRGPVLSISGYGIVRVVRRSVVGLLRLLTFAFIRSILMGNRGAVVTPNMVVVLRRPQ